MTEVEKAKKLAELSRKADRARSDVKHAREHLESDIRFNRDTTLSSNEVKSASKRLQSLETELDRPIYK